MFARQAYEGFILLDESEALHSGTHNQKFTMTLDSWYKRCNAQTPTRSYDDDVITFKEYAGLVAQGRIRKEWKAFETSITDLPDEDKNSAIQDLLQEVGRAREIIPTREFLVAIQIKLLETLERIANHYNFLPMKEKDYSSDSQEPERIIWNAPNTMLYGLFLDLTEQRLFDNNRCLSASKKRIAKLIADNFADKNNKPFDVDDVLRYISGDNPKRIARKIRIDVKVIDKVPDPNKSVND